MMQNFLRIRLGFGAGSSVWGILLLLAPAVLLGQSAMPAIDPEATTLEAVDKLRTAQLFFPEIAPELEAIVQRLERSLGEDASQPLFTDSCHVRPLPDGLEAFIEARQAILGIEKILAEPLPPFVVRTLNEVRVSIVDTYQFLAEVGLHEARALGRESSSQSQLVKAEKEFARALADLGREHYAKAMQSLRQAWQHAQLAISASGGDGNGPRLNIQTPRDGSVLFVGTVTVSGMVQLLTSGTVGPEDVSVTVNGSAAAVRNRSFETTGVSLREGLNAIVGVAEDRDGDTSTTCIAVRFDAAPRALVQAVSGAGQTGPIGAQLPRPFVVRTTDAAGNPISGANVVFRVIQGNGHLGDGQRAAVVTTDVAGQAQVGFVLGTRAGVGVNRVRATAVGFAGEVVFSTTAVPTAPEAIHVVSGNDQKGGVGEALPKPLTVLVIDGGQNPVEGVAVGFEVIAGDGLVNGAASTVALSDENGRASVEHVLGPEPGLDGHLVEARFPGLANEPATFKASGFVLGSEEDTRISGVVLDNQGDPVPGTTLHILGTSLSTTADAEGQFIMTGVPVGDVVLEVDVSTTTRPGVWADLEFELHTLPGIDNAMAQPIYVLPLDVQSGKIAGGAEDVTITTPEVPGFSLTVLAGSATFPDGSPTGLVSVTPVHADKIPMPPGSGMQPRFIVTVQPAGAHFDPPAPVTFPNVDGLAPGTVAEMFSFDHDLGEFVSIGTGTVSEDGLVVRSDPGFGIVKAGWHCAAGSGGFGPNASVHVGITGKRPFILIAGRTPPHRKILGARGGPPRDSDYSWSIADSSIATINPSGGGLHPDSEFCNTEATAVKAGTTTATVEIRCKTTGHTDEDTIEVIVVDVEDVEVHPSDPETAKIDSVLPAGPDTLLHFVTARHQDDVVLRAIVVPDRPEVHSGNLGDQRRGNHVDVSRRGK